MEQESEKLKQKRIEEIVRRLLATIKESNVNTNSYHGDFYKK
jgi:hypothetical protein